ncbi:VOC family protein [Yoonia sp. I 8.24]|uniref:VOC family protein n=1 Tax=Yoonia sp. I 8.24 TaxID=1537229 RepID=UPI001EE1001A|nr:VOC family protein [Yoonia sp. I 8.24]MCG3269296.1 VOC family protein [Yoonia sp. I 8.24]
MKLGAFSVSLNVKDVEKSRDFYRHLGFGDFGGDASQGWLILKNGETVLGLFGGFIGKNTLTFNPGWDQSAQDVDPFDDVRAIQARLLESGITLKDQTDPNGTGPGSISLLDPDGNAILIDQHR